MSQQTNAKEQVQGAIPKNLLKSLTQRDIESLNRLKDTVFFGRLKRLLVTMLCNTLILELEQRPERTIIMTHQVESFEELYYFLDRVDPRLEYRSHVE